MPIDKCIPSTVCSTAIRVVFTPTLVAGQHLHAAFKSKVFMETLASVEETFAGQMQNIESCLERGDDGEMLLRTDEMG